MGIRFMGSNFGIPKILIFRWLAPISIFIRNANSTVVACR